MSDHQSTIVPLETWAFSSPELHISGKEIDIGLFAEALVYYDSVYVVPGNPHFFSLFLKWFSDQGKLDDFLTLVRDGVIKIYDYSFMTTAIEKNGTYSIWNLQDDKQGKENVFEQRFLYNSEVEKILPAKSRHRKHFYEAFRKNVVEAKADSFGEAIENARIDLNDPERSSLIIQALIDELYEFKKIKDVPKINVTITKNESNGTSLIDWNIDFNILNKIAGYNLNLNSGLPLTANAHSNRFLWSAANMRCDLFLPKPMSRLVGDKLYESAERNMKLKGIIENLQSEVDFPSLRQLVNRGILTFDDILNIRKKSHKFRSWLQTASERDRNAIVAYHNELAKETGLAKFGRNSLRLFGILGGGGVGGLIGSVLAGPVGGAIGGLAGSTLTFTTDVCAKIGEDWKPVVFGNWLEDKIKNLHQD